MSALRWLDIGAPAFLLGQAVGRWGNFFNKELYGPETSLPWGIPVLEPGLHFPWDSGAEAYFHPLFLYESLLSLLGVAVLLWAGRRFAHRLRRGDILLLYLVWYSLERSALEFLRSDNWTIGPIATAHLVSLALVALAAAAFFAWRRPPYLAPDGAGVAAGAMQSRSSQRRARRRTTTPSDEPPQDEGSAPD